jgi:hypothetical protein
VLELEPPSDTDFDRVRATLIRFSSVQQRRRIPVWLEMEYATGVLPDALNSETAPGIIASGRISR